jgi:broad specificity phosphatase PhoE
MIYFSRHGESEANIGKIFSNKGFKHPLTANGVSQALKLADLLHNKNITRILSSPILRAIQTASIITNKLNIHSFEVFENLREYDVGDLEGKSDNNSWNLYFENETQWENIEKRHNKLPNGESFIEIQNRFNDFVTKLFENQFSENENILIITHGGLLKIGLPSICNNIDYAFTCNNPINNCELIICNNMNNKMKCLIWGNTVLN